jgi:hypothetical protein
MRSPIFNRLWCTSDIRDEPQQVNGILSILDCGESALAVGEAHWDSIQDFNVARCQAAVRAVKKLGLPREWTPDWQLG